MQRQRLRTCSNRRFLRRAGVVVQVAVMSTLIMGFGALAIDVGTLYTAKAELQSAADSAALAGAAQLVGDGIVPPEDLARQAAQEYAMKHQVAGSSAYLDMYGDVELGKAVLNPETERFEFQPGGSSYDAVRVTVKRTSDSAGGALPLMFANVYGRSEKDMWARAAAVLIPRDIAVVIDLSNSMNHDSQLRYFCREDGGYSNLRDIWAALDGPEPARPYMPGAPWDTEYAGDIGPTYGQIQEWGDYLQCGYDPLSDSGLAYLPRGSSWSSALHSENVLEDWPETPADNMLIAQGYDQWERWAVLTNETEGYLTAVATDGLGFSSRVIWKENVGDSRDKITVYLTSDGDPGTKALSNVLISLPTSALGVALATADSQGSYAVEIVDPDPVTGFTGIKFEGTLGEDGVSETNWFSFEVPRGSGVADVDVVCKAGPSFSYVNHVFESVNKWNTTRWRLRAATVLGLAATWKSGMNGHTGGDGDGMIEGESEIDWLALPPYAHSWNWKAYLNWPKSSYIYRGDLSVFKYRYGLKTYVDFLLERKPQYNRTDVLWATPQQPLRATKDAVQTMVDVITALDSLDYLSLEIFATTAKHQVNLSDDLQAVPDTLYQRQSGHWDRCTNIGGGLQEAINELKSERARPASAKVIVLMSDGVANVDETGEYLGDGAQAAKDYALAMAEQAADEGFRIYSVSVGYNVDRELMQAVASEASGQEFYAAGSPEEYTEQLELIFRTLGGKRPVALIE